MDSGSGSMQSSSGGDEEYDSRTESISAFLNPSNHVASMANHLSHHQPLHNPIHSSSSAPMFDPLSTYFDPLSSRSSPNSLINLDMVWSKNLRSDPNCTDLGGFMSASVMNQQPHQQTRPSYHNCSAQQMALTAAVAGGGVDINHSNNMGTVRGSLLSSSSAGNDVMIVNNNSNSNSNNSASVRNPKKRSRASRRAPTTVLTTDTTNFRAMVQEFTGIPAPPFTSSSSSFPRTRFDLFGSSSSPSSSFRPLMDPSPPPYLLRPFPQKLHPLTTTTAPTAATSFPSSSLSTTTSLFVDAITSTTGNIPLGSTANNSNSNSINYQLIPPHQDLLNLNFHSLLPKYSLNSSSPTVLVPNKPPSSIDDSHLKMGGLEEFGLSHHHNNNHNNTSTTNWSSSGGGSGGGGSNINDQPGEDHIRSINTNYSNNNNNNDNDNNSHRVNNGRPLVNYSGSSKSVGGSFHGDKIGTAGNVTAGVARSEGIVESWICSSD